MSSEPPAYKYFAFISYSRKDSKAAAWLQKRLEWFRFPVKLVAEERRPPNDHYVRPIYRDKTNLEVTDEHYWTNIRRALEESRFLIVLSSPPAAKSEPVDMEVRHFLETHDGDASLVVPVIVNGNVTSEGDDAALCPALRALGDTLLVRNLPTMAPDAVTAEQDAWEAGFVSLVSYLLRLERGALGDHIQRETKRQANVLRRWLAAVILLTLCAIAGGVYSLKQKSEAEMQTQEVIRQKRVVQTQKDKQEELLWSASQADHEAAIKAFSDGRGADGIAYFERALRYAPSNTGALAAAAIHLAGMNASAWRIRSSVQFGDAVTCLSFSPDSRYLAAGSGDGTARVIEMASGKLISTTEFGRTVSCVSFSPDGRHLAAGSVFVLSKGNERMGELRVIEAETGKELCKAKFGNMVSSVSFSPDGRFLAAGSYDNTARVIEAATGKEISRAEFGSFVTSVSFSPDGRYFATGSGGDGSTARVFEAMTGKEISKAEFGFNVNGVSFSPDGRHLAACSDDNTVRVIEAATGKLLRGANIGDAVQCVTFSPDGRYLAAGSDDKTARVIEVATGKLACKIEFGSTVNCVSFSPDGRYLAAGSGDKTARVIEAATGKVITRAEFGGTVNAVSFSPDGRYLAAGSGDDTVRVFEPAAGKLISKAELGLPVNCMSISPDSRHLFACGISKIILVYDVASGINVRKIELGSVVSCVSLSHFGYLAAGCHDETVRVIEAATGKEISKTDLGEMVKCVSFSPDGRFLAAGSHDNTARVIEAATGKEISKAEFGSTVSCVSFSPDGRYLAAGSGDKTARVFETATGKEISKFDLGAYVLSVSFSPDGHRLAVGSTNGTVRMMEPATGKEITVVKFGSALTSMSFSPDGRYFATGSGDNTARLFEVATSKEISKTEFSLAVNSVSFSPDGRYFAAGSQNNTVRVIETQWLNTDTQISAPFAKAMNFASSLRFQSDGKLAPLTADEITQAQTEVAAFIQATPPAEAKFQHAILSWLRMSPETRTTSPWSTELLRVAAGRWFIQARHRTSIADSAEEVPWHPLAPLSLARLEPKPQSQSDAATSAALLIRPRFLARLTLKRLYEADEQLYGRDTLGEYAFWSARVMHELLHLDSEAKEALFFALERTPKEKQKELLGLKAKLSP